MKPKLFYFLFVLYACLTDLSVFSVKYDHISDCLFYNLGFNYGVDNITFVCAEREAARIFDTCRYRCSNYKISMDCHWPGTVNFENCRFSAIQAKFFDVFDYLHTLVISDMEMEKLPMETFRETKKLKHLVASRNNLTEIPPTIFMNAVKLTHVDFSQNLINKIDPRAFLGAKNLKTLDLSQNVLTRLDVQAFKDQSNLEMLNLSNNIIHELDLRNLSAISLTALDVSKNNLTMLKEHTFDKFANLKVLNLSSNPFGSLRLETLFYLKNLEHLNLRKTNISSIQMGTFSNQQKLISLDLCENSLKKLNFDIFLPTLSDLRSLYLGENQFTDLTGFRTSLFPQLNLLDINNNRFNCSYLQSFVTSIKWENILLNDPKSIDITIGGIKCEITNKSSSETSSSEHEVSNHNKVLNDNFFEIYSKLIPKSNADLYLTYICVVMSAFFIMFLFLNRSRIFKIHRSAPKVQYVSHSSFTNQPHVAVVEYSKEVVELNRS